MLLSCLVDPAWSAPAPPIYWVSCEPGRWRRRGYCLPVPRCLQLGSRTAESRGTTTGACRACPRFVGENTSVLGASDCGRAPSASRPIGPLSWRDTYTRAHVGSQRPLSRAPDRQRRVAKKSQACEYERSALVLARWCADERLARYQKPLGSRRTAAVSLIRYDRPLRPAACEMSIKEGAEKRRPTAPAAGQ